MALTVVAQWENSSHECASQPEQQNPAMRYAATNSTAAGVKRFPAVSRHAPRRAQTHTEKATDTALSASSTYTPARRNPAVPKRKSSTPIDMQVMGMTYSFLSLKQETPKRLSPSMTKRPTS